jgi:hypothetical protein
MLSVNLKEGDNMEDLGVDGSAIIKFTSSKRCVRVWAVVMRRQTESSGRML